MGAKLSDDAVLKIDCNNHTRRVLLRVLAVTFPLWALGGAVATLYLTFMGWTGFSKDGIVLFWISLIWFPSLFICSALSLALLKKHLKVSARSISFPGVIGRRLSLQDLSRLSVRAGELCFHFKRRANNMIAKKGISAEKTRKMALARISQKDLLKLIDFLKAHSAETLIDETVNGAAFKNEQIIDAEREVIIPYESHYRKKAFFEVIAHYEKVFWWIWFGLFGPLFVALLPILATVPLILLGKLSNIDMLGSSSSAVSTWLNAWSPSIGAYYSAVISPFSYFFTGYGEFISNNQQLSLPMTLLAALLVIAWLLNLVKPTCFVLGPNGFRLESKLFGLILDLRSFLWTECNKVALQSSGRKTAESILVFYESNGKKLCQLDLKAIPNKKHRLLLKQAIELWAPEIELDPALVETAATAERQTYTELWLQSLNSPPKRDRLAPLQNGDCLQSGTYKIMETIGAGGQGIAYLAEQIDPSTMKAKLVVVKEFVLPVFVDRRARQQAIERFEKESQLLRSLNHENIVALNNHFIEDHRAYLVLEHINGKSLRKMASGKGISDSDILGNLLRQMCAILTYLHSQSPPMVHRDFAPDNLILSETGKLTLIDFNVAHQANKNSKVTVVGKHAYMPPEQFAGRPCPQSDIYALGATLYHLIAGSDPEPFSQSGLPPGSQDMEPIWGEIIRRCTALDARDRFQSANEILERLENKELICSSNGGLDSGETIRIEEAEQVS